MDKNKILSLEHLKVILSAIKNINLSSFKNDLKQQDWNQHNENEPNFIKNKTHYDSREFAKATEKVHYGGHVSIEDYSDVSDELYNYLLYEDVEDITVDGFPITFTGRYTGYVYYEYRNSNNNACSVQVSISEPNKVYVMNHAWSDGWYNNRTVQITYNKSVKGELKQIDNKYISSEIVRDRDLDTINYKLNDCVTHSDYATTSKAGIAKANASYGIQMEGQNLAISPASASDVSAKTNQYKPIVPKYVDYAVQAGLGNSSLTWTETQKTKARSVIGAIGTDDVLQSDWSQENESATDYIKNKPFYDYRKSISSIGANDYLEANLEAEKTYSVSINGVLYTDLLCTEYYWYQNGGATVRILGGTTMDSTTSWKYDFVLYTSTTNNMVRAVCKNTNNFNFPEWTSAYSTGRNVNKSDNVIILDNELTHKQLDEKYIPDNIPKIATATIGQTLEVESVDEDGKPTKWKAVDKSAGGGGIDKAYVESVEQTTTSTASGGTNIVTVTKSDGSTNEVEILNGKDGMTPYIDTEGYFTYGDPNIYPKKVFEHEWKDNYDKIDVTAIDYENGILTVSSMPSQITDNASTTVRVFAEIKVEGITVPFKYGMMPKEIMETATLYYAKKVGENQIVLCDPTTSAELTTITSSDAVNLTRWNLFVEKSRNKAINSVTVKNLEMNHKYRCRYYLPHSAHYCAGIVVNGLDGHKFGNGYGGGYPSKTCKSQDLNSSFSVMDVNVYETVSLRGKYANYGESPLVKHPRFFEIDIYRLNNEVFVADSTIGYFAPFKTPVTTTIFCFTNARNSIYLQSPFSSISFNTGNGNYILDGARCEVWDYGEVF